MTYRKLLFTLGVVLGLTLATGQIAAADYTGFTIPAEPVLPEAEVHPSIWFSADKVEEIRGRSTHDDFAAKLWAQIQASPYLTRDLPEIPPSDADKKTVHKYYGDIPQFAMYNAFMYQMTEDEEQKAHYLERATAALLRAYDGFLYEIDPKDQSTAADEIYRGVWAQNFSAAYDWVQPALTEEQDAAIRAPILKEARYMNENLFSWASRPHNHLSKPAWGLGSFALTFSNEPNASDWLASAIKASNMNTELFFSEDGIYREGGMYYVFSAINFIPFLYHYHNAAGVDAFGYFQPAFEWPVAIRNGKGWLPNIEDSFIRPSLSHMATGAYADASTYLHSSASLGEVLMWNFQNTDFTAFDLAEEKTTFNYSGASWDYAKPLVEYLCYDPSVEPIAPDVSPTVFLASGETAFRNDWSFKSPDHRFLLFQGVAEANNHQHMEHLSFIIFAENQMMASDSGYTRKSYGEKIRREWYLTAKAHNVVMLNGSAPEDVEENVTPISRHRIDTDYFDFEEKEAVYPNGGKLRRAVAFPGEEYFVVADIVDTPEPAKAELVFHGGRSSLKSNGSYHLWQYEDDDYGPAAQFSSWILSQGAKFEEHMGEVTYIKGDFAEYPYLTAGLETEGTNFLTILVPHKSNTPPPAVQEMSGPNYLAARVEFEDKIDTFIVQSESNPIAVGNIQTDATFAYVRVTGNEIHFAVRDATTLSLDGEALFSSAEPATKADKTN